MSANFSASTRRREHSTTRPTTHALTPARAQIPALPGRRSHHNVANHSSQRGELARLLSVKCDALVLTSATPHNGRPESFANLMRMLDPTSVADPRLFTLQDVEHLLVRRFKKDVEAEAGGQLQERDVAPLAVLANQHEEAALAAIHRLDLSTLGRKAGRRDPLLRWTLVKAFLSSPEAGLESLENRMQVTTNALHEGPTAHPRAADLERDLEKIAETMDLVRAACGAGSSKLFRLLAELKAIGFDGSPKSPRVVIFSERIKTLEMLEEAFLHRLGMKPGQIALYTASDESGDIERRKIIESFGQLDSQIRVLLCSDAASEGVNLHHQCHHLFHFDVPWSLIRMTQRNGRIDRFGQRHVPQLRYLITQTAADTADQRILTKLVEKEKEVERQLGDSGALLGLYDADAEEKFLLRGVARGEAAEQLLPDAPLAAGSAAAVIADDGAVPAPEPETPAMDLLALFDEVQRAQSRTPGLDTLIGESRSLFANDYDLLVAALRHLEGSSVVGPEPLKWTHDDATASVEVFAPEPFRRHREGFLPREAVPERDSPYRLAMGRELVTSKLRTALDDEGRWPDWHLLWEQHPMFEWLLDALGSVYARGEAPLLRIAGLGKGQALFLLQGMMFNQESEAVAARWLGIATRDDSITADDLDLDGVIQRVGLSQPLVNTGQEVTRAAALQRLVPKVVAEARARVIAGRRELVRTELIKRARKETRRLETWVGESNKLIDAQEAKWTSVNRKVPKHVQDRLAAERRHVMQVKSDHEQFLASLQKSGEPYVRVVAVFAGE